MTAAAAARIAKPSMTVEEFLLWPGDGTGRKFELVHGVPRAMAPASDIHGMIQLNIGTAINNHLRGRKMPCRAGTELPVVPRMLARKNARAPDVAVTCAPPSTTGVTVDPILIVEILSPSNEDDTWESIGMLASLASLTEILVVQSTRVGADVYRRAPGQDWPDKPVSTMAGGTIHLASIGLDLPIADVYADTFLQDAASGRADPTA
jgi:Uma2 family endonuclease